MNAVTEQQRRITEMLKWGLGPTLCLLLDDPKVTDIMLNPDGTLWVKRLGQESQEIGRMESSQAESLMGNVAGVLNTVINAKNPLLNCELPFDGSRFSAELPPVVPGPAFCIRKKAIAVFTLQDYVDQGIMTEAQRLVIDEAVRDKQNILVVGGTGTGKTTLTNAVMNHIVDVCPNVRIVILEDTWELQCTAKNRVEMRSSADTSMTELLKQTLRKYPDRIVVGEVRDGAALDLLDAWNTAHPGGVATLHANSARSVFTRLETLVSRVSLAPMQGLIVEAVNLIIHIENHDGSRRIKEICKVRGHDGQKYLTESIGETNV